MSTQPHNPDLQRMLEENAKCEYCQGLILNHNLEEALTCLQEISKRDERFTTSEFKRLQQEKRCQHCGKETTLFCDECNNLFCSQECHNLEMNP